MWIALFMRRLPAGLSRCRCFGPEDAGIGALPLREAKWRFEGTRPTSPTSPIIRAAISSPTPTSSTRPLPSSRTRRRISRSDLAAFGLDLAEPLDPSPCEARLERAVVLQQPLG